MNLNEVTNRNPYKHYFEDKAIYDALNRRRFKNKINKWVHNINDFMKNKVYSLNLFNKKVMKIDWVSVIVESLIDLVFNILTFLVWWKLGLIDIFCKWWLNIKQ